MKVYLMYITHKNWPGGPKRSIRLGPHGAPQIFTDEEDFKRYARRICDSDINRGKNIFEPGSKADVYVEMIEVELPLEGRRVL